MTDNQKVIKVLPCVRLTALIIFLALSWYLTGSLFKGVALFFCAIVLIVIAQSHTHFYREEKQKNGGKP